MNFFIATKNLKKLEELKRILVPLGIELLCERDFDCIFPEVDETGSSFAENALIKAVAGMKATGMPTIADDSGLCVDALNGAPGVYSARYAGEPTDSNRNNQKLLAELNDVPKGERTAYFECAIACVFPDGRQFTVSGKCDGQIAFDIKGSNGFGYDVLFLSELGRFSEISDGDKDSISHRGRALIALKAELSEMLKDDQKC